MTPLNLIDLLLENNYSYITGVPDSIFKYFLLAVDREPRFKHIITNNEGESAALAAGYHLATGKIPVIYMQNSGLGNAINPLTSLLDENIYSIPSILMIAWRGMPGESDEPQHKKMGDILPGMLSLLGIPYAVADSSVERMQYILKQAKKHFKTRKQSFAILFPKNVIAADKSLENNLQPKNALLRESLLEWLVANTTEKDVLITTTGKTSRELYEIRERQGQDHSRDFLTVGSMGCASTLALGIAMERKDRRVILVDGDGACLMRLEALATIGAIQPSNLLHLVIDNNAYESTGSQKTLSHHVDFVKIAEACGYAESMAFNQLSEVEVALKRWKSGLAMWVIKTFPHSRDNLGRPKTSPLENKQSFMQALGIEE